MAEKETDPAKIDSRRFERYLTESLGVHWTKQRGKIVF